MVEMILSGEKFDQESFQIFCAEEDLEFPEDLVSFVALNNDCEFEDNFIKIDNERYSIKYLYGSTKERYSNIAKQYEDYEDRVPKGLIPIGRDDFENQICIAIDDEHYGKIYFWDHETMDPLFEMESDIQIDQMPLLASSFTEFINKLENV